MIRALSSGHYSREIREGEALPSLEAELRPLCREPFRRIDRFIQLALLGSGRCAQGQSLRPDCGLYVSSCVGPVSNNIIVQENIIRDRLLPKPFNFVNTLGSSTGYYIAKNFGLSGQAMFLSRSENAFDSALETALDDLELGIVKQALLGVVEEVTLPLPEYRRRARIAPGGPVWERSHWLLLESPASSGMGIDLTEFKGLLSPGLLKKINI